MITSDKERQAPTCLEETDPTYLARYQFAGQYISPGDLVLDALCGTGFGVKLLASKGTMVYGVDIHPGAIAHAQEFFSDDRADFYVGNAENLKELFPTDNFFDVIVSFEGIEHTRHPELFLAEVKRLLKPQGKFIISTPRRPHGSPYHFTEYSLAEFKKVLSAKFKIKQMFGQIYTDIFDLAVRPVNPDDYQKFNFIAYCGLE